MPCRGRPAEGKFGDLRPNPGTGRSRARFDATFGRYVARATEIELERWRSSIPT
jgi:hypothetical protein